MLYNGGGKKATSIAMYKETRAQYRVEAALRM